MIFLKINIQFFIKDKLKLQQNDIRTKRFTRLSFQIKVAKYEKLRKGKQKQNQTKTSLKKQKKKKKRKRERDKKEKKTHPIFPNDF